MLYTDFLRLDHDFSPHHNPATDMRFSPRMNLTHHLLTGSFAVLLVGTLVMGVWFSGATEKRLIDHEGELYALYVDSVLSDQAQALASGGLLSDADMLALDKLLHATKLAERIVAFKLWSRDGRILYSTDLTQIGQQSEIKPALAAAFQGETQTRIFTLKDDVSWYPGAHASQLIGIYAPVHLLKSGLIPMVAEIRQGSATLAQDIDPARQQSWLMVIAASSVMYLLLFVLIRRASKPIVIQKQQMQENVSQLTNRLAEKERVLERVTRAAAGTTSRNERLLHSIAVDLHDGPIQGIALAAMRMETLAKVCINCSSAAGAESPVAEEFRRLQEALNSAQQDVRALSKGLHLPNIEELPLADVARRVIRDYKRSSGIDVELTISDVPEDAPLPVKLTLFRLLQESLANGLRHGGAAKQLIALSSSDSRLQVSVRDDGKGFDPQTAQTEGHMGLEGMRERVELLGGTFYIWSAVGQGTVVRADIPLTSGDDL